MGWSPSYTCPETVILSEANLFNRHRHNPSKILRLLVALPLLSFPRRRESLESRGPPNISRRDAKPQRTSTSFAPLPMRGLTSGMSFLRRRDLYGLSVISGFALTAKGRVPYIMRHALHCANASEAQTRQRKWRNNRDSLDNIVLSRDFSEFAQGGFVHR